MTEAQMRELLASELAKFRKWSYAALARRIERDRHRDNCDCLEHIEGVSSDGTEYQIEFNIFWDDRPHQDIRVCGDLSVEPQKRLLGFLPLYISHMNDGFIMRPDGSFVGEEM